MLRFEQHGDVTRIHMSTTASRAIGYAVSAYLVGGVLIDIGFPGVRSQVAELLRARRPRGVLLTHSHEDHAGNAPLAAALGVPLAASTETLALLRAAPRIELYRRIVWGQPKPLPEHAVPFADDRMQLIATPGHSRDHHVVWDAERESVFGGDLFVGVKVRLAHADEEPRTQVRSLRMVAALRPRLLLDSHRGVIADAVPALLAKADWMEETIGAIERRIAEGWSDRAITRDVLGREEPARYVSAGHYSRVNLVRAVRAEGARGQAAGARVKEKTDSSRVRSP